MSDKIQPQHRARKAMLYVRQSSAFQVAHNQESQKLQYAMQTRLRDLGFTDIEVTGVAGRAHELRGSLAAVAGLWRPLDTATKRLAAEGPAGTERSDDGPPRP